uniref:Uncharacterized protein n=1 Tax=Arundo donax TaxID=35708 RepID=A0A0A8ZVX7_ARUDO
MSKTMQEQLKILTHGLRWLASF